MEKPSTPKVTSNKLALVVLQALRAAIDKLDRQNGK